MEQSDPCPLLSPHRLLGHTHRDSLHPGALCFCLSAWLQLSTNRCWVSTTNILYTHRGITHTAQKQHVFRSARLFTNRPQPLIGRAAHFCPGGSWKMLQKVCKNITIESVVLEDTPTFHSADSEISFACPAVPLSNKLLTLGDRVKVKYQASKAVNHPAIWRIIWPYSKQGPCSSLPTLAFSISFQTKLSQKRSCVASASERDITPQADERFEQRWTNK